MKNIESDNIAVNSKIKDLIDKLDPITLDQYKQLENNQRYTDVEYLGWSSFIDENLKIYFKVGENRSAFCVASKNYLMLNQQFLKKKEYLSLEFRGIHLDSKGQEYASIFVIINRPLQKRNT